MQGRSPAPMAASDARKQVLKISFEIPSAERYTGKRLHKKIENTRSKNSAMDARKLPPRVIGSRSRNPQKTLPNPWFQHLARLTPTMACVVFAVLIAGAVGVRQVIILVRNGQTSEPVVSQAADEKPTVAASTAEPAKDDETSDTGADLTQESAEPELEVLPPPAAKKPGRKLPRMLLVGDGPTMFPQLEQAMKVAIGGDIIEIRTNKPLFLEPQKAVWKGKIGNLTVRGGTEFRPVFVRRTLLPGRLLQFISEKPDSKCSVMLQDISIINITPPNPKGEGTQHSAVFATCPLQVRRCVIATTNGAISWYPSAPGNKALVAECYLIGLDNGTADMITFLEGHMEVSNNLIVQARRPLNINRDGHMIARNNTLLHCRKTLSIYGKSSIKFYNNLIAFQRSYHAFVVEVGDHPYREIQQMISYQAQNNFYFNTNWGIYPQYLQIGTGLSAWQRITRNGEKFPHIIDPMFSNLRLVLAAKEKIVLPTTFSLSPSSPAKGAGTDGADIGCDLSRIPVPPPMVEQLIQQALQSQ
jgi:hypothetical protein